MTDPDDLADLLAPRPGPAGSDALFARTERVLWRGRQLRRLGRAGAVAAVFVAGGLAGWVGKPDRERVATVEVVVAVPVVVPVEVEVPSSGLASGGREPPDSQTNRGAHAPRSPSQAELLAEQADDPAEAARLYRLAGDLYLNDRQDFRQAGRCYRLHLARAGAAGRAPQPGDSWLLLSLKQTTPQETVHATRTDG